MNLWQKLAHKLLGWDYVGFVYQGKYRVARLHLDKDGRASVVAEASGWSSTDDVIRIDSAIADKMVWLTCSRYAIVEYVPKEQRP